MKNVFPAIFVATIAVLLFQNFRYTSNSNPNFVEPNLARRGKLTYNKSARLKLIPMATTPDGRVIVNRLPRISYLNGTRSPLVISFQSLIQFNRNELWLNSQSLDGLVQQDPQVAFEVPYTLDDGNILYDPTEEGLPSPAAGSEFRDTGTGLRQGTVFFDTRFGETAFPVNNPSDCISATVTGTDIQYQAASSDYLCYKLIVMMPVNIGEFKNGILQSDEIVRQFHRAYQTRMSMVLQTNSAGTALRFPIVKQAVFNDKFRMSLMAGPVVDGRPTMSGVMGLEISSNSDGRLVIWNEDGVAPYAPTPKGGIQPGGSALAMFSYNETPYARRTWKQPVYFNELNKYYGNTPICPRVPITQSCSVSKVPLKSLFRIAESQLYAGTLDSNGQKTLLSNTYRCSYGWLTPDGSHVICGNPGMSTALIGPGTGHSLKKIDVPANGFNEARARRAPMTEVGSTALDMPFCVTANQQDCFLSLREAPGGFYNPKYPLTERPQMSLGLGTTSGFWQSMNNTRPRNWLLSARQPSYQMLLRNDLLSIYRPPKIINNDALTIDDRVKLVTHDDDLSFFEYAEISIAFNEDKSFLFFYQMDPAMDSFGKESVGQVADATGRFNLGQLRAGALFEDKFYEAKFDLPLTSAVPSGEKDRLIYSADGFVGRGVVLTRGASAIKARLPDVDGIVREFSFEMALKPMQIFSNLDVTLASWPTSSTANAFKLRLINSHVLALTLTPVDSSSIEVQAPILDQTMIPKTNHFSHIGVSLKAPQVGSVNSTVTIYLDGKLLKSALINIPRGLATANYFYVGPNGSCTEKGAACATVNPLMMIDEVGLSKSSRSEKYFRIAAYQKNSDIDPKAVGTLYPHSIPVGFNATDLRIPPALGEYMSDKVNYARLVSVGQMLFADNILSTYGNNNGTYLNRGKNCANCHNSSQALAFTDGEITSPGLIPGMLNSPTLINRIFAKEQFFDQRSQDLMDQVLRPIRNSSEMGGIDGHIASAISANTDYAYRFNQIRTANPDFPSNRIEQTRIALAAFVGSIRSGVDLNSINNGLGSTDKIRFVKGQRVFFGRGRCVACHSGPNFSDEIAHDNFGVGTKFKTPTLINISKTAPYMHGGTHRQLKDVIDFYNNPSVSPNTDIEIKPLGLTDEETDALEFFLKNLNANISFGNED